MTDCDFESVSAPDAQGFRHVRCRRCGFTSPRPTASPLDRCFRNCDLMTPDSYVPAPVGAELSLLLAELGIEPKSSCGCAAKAEQMDKWGIAGCEAHREVITGWLRENYHHATWLETIRAAWRGSFTINPLVPFNSLLDEAIRRTEAKEKTK